jgi:cytochrome c oxidase cbb3-type subunit 3
MTFSHTYFIGLARTLPVSSDSSLPDDDVESGVDPAVARWVFLAMFGLMAAGFLAYYLLAKAPAPAPPEVTGDPLLVLGRSIYMARCATCHGQEGKGDGATASYLSGPPVGDLTDGKWKHGDKPRDVMSVISKGVEGTRMTPLGQFLEPLELRAVTAYVFYLAKQPVPVELRMTEEPPGNGPLR